VGETGLRVTAPDHRLDIGTGVVGAADLIEEVAHLRLRPDPGDRAADRLPPQPDALAVTWKSGCGISSSWPDCKKS
jgi:hypothetical protein